MPPTAYCRKLAQRLDTLPEHPRTRRIRLALRSQKKRKHILPLFLYIEGIVFCTNIYAQVRQLIFVGFRRESGEIRKIPISSFSQSDFLCGIS
jgi:hypothetical protein